jgi:hypothetical protein
MIDNRRLFKTCSKLIHFYGGIFELKHKPEERNLTEMAIEKEKQVGRRLSSGS